MKDATFLFDEFYLHEGKRSFLEQLELRYTILFEMQYQQIMNNANSLFVLFQQLNANIFKIKNFFFFKKKNVF
jgi:hypothetical protein